MDPQPGVPEPSSGPTEPSPAAAQPQPGITQPTPAQPQPGITQPTVLGPQPGIPEAPVLGAQPAATEPTVLGPGPGIPEAPVLGAQAGVAGQGGVGARVGVARSRLGVAWPWLVVVAVTLVSSLLRVRSPMWLVDAPNDDGLFTRLAGHLIDGEWLGPYNELTLAKGPGYPLFIAAAYQLHVPLKLAEHAVHLLACAVMGLAVWRVFRSRGAGLAAYAALALNPAYLGVAAARIGRDAFYGSLTLLLAGSVVLVVASVPDLAARGWRWAVPVVVVAGPVVGLVGAGYYLTREERTWVVPALAVAVLGGFVSWPRRRRITVANGLVLGGFALLVALTGVWAIGWTASQNQREYGTSVTADLAGGEVARAYGEWQRVEAGHERRYVPVSAAQRDAVYRISPAAADLAGPFSYEASGWIGLGCSWIGVCDDYIGGFFVWAMRDAAAASGHADSGAEEQRYFGEIADDIARACDSGELRCSAPPIGPLPPLDRIHMNELGDSVWYMADAFLAYNVGEPDRPPSGGGNPGYWETLTHPMRGVGSEADYLAAEPGRLHHQEVVSGLTDLYRPAVRVGVLVALAGLLAGIATRAGRRNWAALLLVTGAFVAVLTRLLLLALIDATAWPATKSVNYILPVTDFMVLFVLLGAWTLARVLLAWRARAKAAPEHEAGPEADSLSPATAAP
jgi:hypothetical protein